MRDLRETWKATRTHTAADMLMYCLLRAIKAKTNDKRHVLANLIYKSFSPVTNERKLTNGSKPWDGVYTATNAVAVDGASTSRQEAPTLALLYSCIDSDEERNLYRQLLYALLNRTIKLTDRSYACFLVRQDMPREQQVMQTTQAALLLGRATSRSRTRVGRLGPMVSTANLQFLVFGAQDEDAFQARMVEIGQKVSFVRARQTVREAGNTMVRVTICTMPIRASVMRRKRLFEGCKRISL